MLQLSQMNILKKITKKSKMICMCIGVYMQSDIDFITNKNEHNYKQRDVFWSSIST